jgi:SAM-dependent methyltransferase
MQDKKQWFETWFDQQYYDLLYQHRDEDEAAAFLDTLMAFLHPTPGSTMLDAACGKGRHASYLAEKGFEVTGIDLSYKNIKEAKNDETEMLSFFQHDMSRVFRVNYFDFIFNFYTSFGYYKEEKQDLACIRAFASGLKKGGKLIIDFFNINYILKHLVEELNIKIDDYDFNISKSYENGFIIKKIEVSSALKKETFYESVRAINLQQFEHYFSSCGLTLIHKFGDYKLNAFDSENSERLILVAQK